MLDTHSSNTFQGFSSRIRAEIDALSARIEATPGDPSSRVLNALLTIELELLIDREAERVRDDARRVAAQYFGAAASDMSNRNAA
jgi:2,3-bisphosphoglycerate-independent phosphoglycerate mutase